MPSSARSADCASNSPPYWTPSAKAAGCSAWPGPHDETEQHAMTTPTPPASPPAPAPASATPSAPASSATSPAATPAPAPASGTDHDRLTSLERGLAEIKGMLTGGPATHAAPATRDDIEAIAVATIEQGKQAQAAADAEAQREGRLKAVENSLAKLRETKPKEPTRRITRMFWPGHDRD